MAKAKKKKITLEEALVPAEECPYEVPVNWCWTRIKYISEVVTGSTPSKKHEEYYGGEFPFFKPADLDAGKNMIDASEYLSEEGRKISRIIPKESTAVCCIGTIGKSGFLMVDGTTNQQINSMIPKINPLYVYYYSKTNEFINELWDKSTSTTISLINKKNMETNNVPLPPLAEQKRIVERIESLFSKLDEAKEKAQEVLDSFELRRIAILYEAFNGKLTQKWRERNAISSEFAHCTISDLFTHVTGKALKRSNQEGRLHKYITTSNLYWGHFDFTEVREMYFNDNELEKCTATKGDILICNGGDVGRTAIWDYDYDICIQNHISKLRKKNDNVDLRYFYYYFLFSKLRGNINGKGIGIVSLSAKSILSMEVELPIISEQKEIARILDEIFRKEDMIKDNVLNILERIELTKKSILAKAFRGELGTNNVEEESSIELLKKVLEEDK